MEFTSDFFKEEVRCDYLVTTEIKKLWSFQLTMLEEVDRICKKYNLPYYAYGGTMLGAIRHKGYIPWDDDIDVAMWREDYEIFQKVAAVELKPPYFLQTPYTDPNYGGKHIKIRNSNTTSATRHEMTLKHNRGIYIDIFPLDRVSDDDAEIQANWVELKKLKRLIDIGIRNFWYIGKERELVTDEERKAVLQYLDENGLAKTYAKMEALLKRFNHLETKRCSWAMHPDIVYNCEWFTEPMYVPFENTKIPVPKAYDAVLTSLYGDYMVPVKGASLHGKMFISTEIPYTDYKIED